MEQLQLDLVDMRSQVVEYNGKSYRYILSLIDIFSRFHWLVPLQRKFASHVAFHLNRTFTEHEPPDRLQTDNGVEFKKHVIKVNKYNLDITLNCWEMRLICNFLNLKLVGGSMTCKS